MTTVSDIARQAIAILEKGWTQVEPACDENGRAVAVWANTAVAWTLMGALCAVPSDAKTDRIKLSVMGKMRVYMPKTMTFVDANTSREAAIAMLTRCL